MTDTPAIAAIIAEFPDTGLARLRTYLTADIHDAIRRAVLAERERCAALLDANASALRSVAAENSDPLLAKIAKCTAEFAEELATLILSVE